MGLLIYLNILKENYKYFKIMNYGFWGYLCLSIPNLVSINIKYIIKYINIK